MCVAAATSFRSSLSGSLPVGAGQHQDHGSLDGAPLMLEGSVSAFELDRNLIFLTRSPLRFRLLFVGQQRCRPTIECQPRDSVVGRQAGSVPKCRLSGARGTAWRRAAAGLFCGVVLPTFAQSSRHDLELADGKIRTLIDSRSGGVMAIGSPEDRYGTNFVIGRTEHPDFDVSDSRWLGDLVIRYRRRGGEWREATTGASDGERRVHVGERSQTVTVNYTGESTDLRALRGISCEERYNVAGGKLHWTIRLKNLDKETVEIGGLGLPMLFNTMYAKDPAVTYQKRVIRHSYVEGSDSFVLVTRANGEGPYLLMTPEAGTRLEYFESADRSKRSDDLNRVFAQRGAWEGLYTAYIHAAGEVAAEEAEYWRQPLTRAMLAPAGEGGDEVRYGFTFQMTPDYESAKRAMLECGLLVVDVSPGMVLPADLPGLISLRGKKEIHSVRAEFPGETEIEREPGREAQQSLYRVRFRRLGENEITVEYGEGESTRLEYFVTEPLASLIKKRAAFLVAHQQVKDPSKWYDGLFSLWDMRAERLRTPEDTGGLQTYMVGGSDDPDLCKAPYIAAKNVAYPDDGEIAAVEYYIEHFLWGKLQRSDTEDPYPFGIYGSPVWKENRNSSVGYGSGGNGREHLWRTFDYTHVIQLYFLMYEIAKMYPDRVHYATAGEYLRRAYRTAMAYFEVPYAIRMGEPWDFRGYTDWAFKQGAFHEVFITDLIGALEEEKKDAEAATLRSMWDRKVMYFLSDHPYPFGSEMYFDTTAFESTHAIARYAAQHRADLAAVPWTDKNSGVRYAHDGVSTERVEDFTRKEILANTVARGMLETNYYQLGSDIRQEGSSNYLLSYMTQMGGWALLDYGVSQGASGTSSIDLGYASYLAGWADVNSGTPASGFGYWYPGRGNDGAAGWGFNPQSVGTTFMDGIKRVPRGLWPYDGEIDSGFSGSFQAARTVVFRHPLFGLIADGAVLEEHGAEIGVECRDGLNQRMDVLLNGKHLQIALDRDGFAEGKEQRVRENLSRLQLKLASRDVRPHVTTVHLNGLRAGRYRAIGDGVRSSQTIVVRTDPIEVHISMRGDGSSTLTVEELAK